MLATVHAVGALIVRSLWVRGRRASQRRELAPVRRRQYYRVAAGPLAGPGPFRAVMRWKTRPVRHYRTTFASSPPRLSHPVVGVCRYSSGFRPAGRDTTRLLPESTPGERARPHATRLRGLW